MAGTINTFRLRAVRLRAAEVEDHIHVIDKPILIGNLPSFFILGAPIGSIIGSLMRYKLGESMKRRVPQRYRSRFGYNIRV